MTTPNRAPMCANAAREAAAPDARHVCREHLEPVTWRGTGCRACRARSEAYRAEVIARRSERAARRLARLHPDRMVTQ